MNLLQHIQLAWKTASGFHDFFFHLGYQQLILPRWFRKLVTRSELHKAWLSGYTGAGICKVLEREAENQRLSEKDIFYDQVS